MKKFLTFIVVSLSLGNAAYAQGISDLASGGAVPIENVPLGIPEMLWWLLGIAVVCFGIHLLARVSVWVADRLYEPSTHLSAACFFGFGGMFLDSLTLDPSPPAQALLIAAAVEAFWGLIKKEGGR